MRCSISRGAGPPHAGAGDAPRLPGSDRDAGRAGAGAVAPYHRRAVPGAYATVYTGTDTNRTLGTNVHQKSMNG
jgi:hypothetical protein